MNADEKRVAKFLLERKFLAAPFLKSERRAGKTPDFRVSTAAGFAFFCEVKSVERDAWPDARLGTATPREIVGGIRNDPVFNRLTDDIHTAAGQFDAVNPSTTHPNVLAIVNHDKGCGFLDLIAVVTGRFVADDGSMDFIYGQFSEGRIRTEKQRIHLYVWLDDFKPEQLMFSQSSTLHHEQLCSWFRVRQEDIRQLRP
jgi:hypothetical protein